MDVAALQQRLRDFAAARDWQAYHTPKNLAMALMVEAAELLELFQWLTVTESRAYAHDAARKEHLADEVADVLLYLLQLADHTGVDIEQAVERKLLKNAEKHPAKHAPPPVVAPVPEAPKVHVLVDWENVQPDGEALRQLVPEGTDVWLFHGPQQKVDTASHRQAFGDDRVTLVPRSGAGKNALDFQLTYYVGYIAARRPDAVFVVVSNDHGYDPMLEHARTLGFDARRREIVRPCASPSKSAAKQVPPATVSTAGAKAKADDVKVLVDRLTGLAPASRPVRKDALMGLIQSHFHEIGAPSSRASHALSVLQAQRHVALKGDAVSYPLLAAQVEAGAPAKTPAKKPAAKKVPAKKPSPASVVAVKTAKPATPAQIAQRVLVSLKKMPKNKPTTRAGLLKLIETHATKAADPKAMAQQVCVLLEARKAVMPGPNGKGVVYSGDSPQQKAAQ